MTTRTLTPHRSERPGGLLDGVASGVRDTAIVLSRELRPVLRDPFSVVFSMVQPLFFLALFAPLLTGVGGVGGGQGALQWFVGIVVMSCLFGASMTGSNLLMEMQTGVPRADPGDPAVRSSLLLGRALKEILPVLVQAVIVPVDAGPGWLRALSRATPLTYIVDAMRELFAGSVYPGLPAQGLLAAVVVCAVGLTVGLRSMRAAD